MPTSQAHCFWVETGRLTSQMIIRGQAASDHVNTRLLPKTLVFQPLTHRPPPKMLLWAFLNALLPPRVTLISGSPPHPLGSHL